MYEKRGENISSNRRLKDRIDENREGPDRAGEQELNASTDSAEPDAQAAKDDLDDVYTEEERKR